VNPRALATIHVVLKCVYMAPDVSYVRIQWTFAPETNSNADATRWWNRSHNLKMLKHADVMIVYDNAPAPASRTPQSCLPSNLKSSSSFFTHADPWFNAVPHTLVEPARLPEEPLPLYPNPFGNYEKNRRQHQQAQQTKTLAEIQQPLAFQLRRQRLQSLALQPTRSWASPEDGEDEDDFTDLQCLGETQDVEKDNNSRGSLLDWNTSDVGKWLARIGLQDYRGTFADNCIDGKTLASISEEFTSALGVENEIHKTLFWRELKILKQKVFPEEVGEAETTDQTKTNFPGESEIPCEFFDTISFELMRDPVFTCDGHTYERKSISLWLETHNTSPITGLPLENKKLVPNFALKSLLQRYLD